MTDLEKMADGQPFWGFNPVFTPLLEEKKDLCFRYNQLLPSDKVAGTAILHALFRKMGEDVIVNAPIHVDLGNVEIGKNTIINFNFVALDEALVSIGAHCFIGPNCSLYTVMHSLCAEERNKGLMMAKPVVIHDDCWIGGNVTVLPGVTIGKGAVIGAGSLVTKNVPAGVLAYGNPCCVVREISAADRYNLKKARD
ncbi:MAG: sugar O-acetyltransferase [Bacteroidaceae bacterium]|nr:sugar O-acetyltransferase [Bacteroidaceae bacterium]